MKVEQLYTKCIAEAAYYIESEGEVAIIDPLRETEPYIKMASENNAKIKYVFETHFHADFVSGHVDLANETGATIVFGPGAKTNYDVHVAKDNEEFKVGKLTIKVLHTPGHTPESATFLLFDEKGKPYCIFSGDTLFIGDVGRPDLAVKGDLTQEDLAGMMYDSLRNKIMPLPDDILVYPAHGAGSACGKSMSKETFSTLGEQKQTNYALQEQTKEDFIKVLTTGIAPPPQYFPKNAMMNKNGYINIYEVMEAAKIGLNVDSFKEKAQNGALILDVRHQDEFRQGFIKNSINIPLDGQFASWVGTLIEDIKANILLVAPEDRVQEAVMRLSRVGYDNTIGYLEGGFEVWKTASNETEAIDQVSATELVSLIANGAKVLDVRKPSEFEAEHAETAMNSPLDYLNEGLRNLDSNETYYVHCKSGYRSMIANSILKKNGFKNIIDIKGGFDAILEEGNITITEFICPSTKA